jgi:hypothetical protein
MTDPYRDDFSVARLRAKVLPAEWRTYQPETLRCQCGYETRQVTAAWVHAAVQHGYRLGRVPG